MEFLDLPTAVSCLPSQQPQSTFQGPPFPYPTISLCSKWEEGMFVCIILWFIHNSFQAWVEDRETDLPYMQALIDEDRRG